MKVTESNNNVIIKEQSDFELAHIFDCGQCFRFSANNDGSYTGTAFGRTVRISKRDGDIVLHNTSAEDFWSVWKDYFDLDRDYGMLKAQLKSDRDPVMTEAVKYGSGIRILRQDLWETMISFIISASNNIPRIKKIIELLCANFGDAHCYEGNMHYSFPSPQRLASLELGDLSVIRAGFRDKYILNCAKKVCSGEIDLDHIKSLSTHDAKKSLMSIYGIGNKVSDCILLFGLSKCDAFPIDVWIKRVMEYCYFGNEPQSIKAIADFADKRFGELGGIAQQYLFFYARERKIGI